MSQTKFITIWQTTGWESDGYGGQSKYTNTHIKEFTNKDELEVWVEQNYGKVTFRIMSVTELAVKQTVTYAIGSQ